MSDEQRTDAQKWPRSKGLSPGIGASGVATLGNSTTIIRQHGVLPSPMPGLNAVADNAETASSVAVDGIPPGSLPRQIVLG